MSFSFPLRSRQYFFAVVFGLAAINAHAQFTLTGTVYTQNFDGIGLGLPSGWDVRTAAGVTSLGTIATFNTTTTTWGTGTGQFANMASSDGLTSAASTAQQNASTDRVIGVRQVAAGNFDPGAAIDFNFNASLANFSGAGTAVSLSLQMLSVQGRSTTWSIQYGLGNSPSSWTTISTWSDPGVFGSTGFTFTGTQLSALSGQSDAWIRVVALTASAGSNNRDSIGLDDFTLNFSAVPEPGTWLAGALTLSAIGWSQRRRVRALLRRAA
jgi:hypothetical protein